MTETPGSSPEKKDQPSQPQAQPEAPKTDAEKAEAEKKAAAEKKDEGKKDVVEQAKAGLDKLGLGGDFGFLMKRLFETFGKFMSSFEGIKDNIGGIFLSQSPEEVQKIMDESKNYKVPKIQNVDAITATLEDPQPEEKLVVYLYRCLKVPIPTAEQLEPHKTLDIRHLMFQMMGSFQFAKGKKEIRDGFTKKPEKFFKDDLVFFRNKIDGEITAGFVQKIGENSLEITTIDETGTKRTIPKTDSMCLLAFHIPTNKSKGPVPIEKKEDKKDDKKVDQ